MIIRKSIRETTGTERNVAQSFKQNIFFDSSEGVVSPFIFETPMYTTIGGTKDYYGQNPLAIFTNLVKPFIRFDFSANTASFGPNVYIRHDIYRVDWDTFSSVQDGYKAKLNLGTKSQKGITETIEEVDGVTGAISKRTITRNISEVFDTTESTRKVSDRVAGMDSAVPTIPTISDIQDLLDTPLYSITAYTSAITTSVYDLQIDQFTKNLGEFKTELFQDKAQYIVDTNFVFNIDVTPGLINYEIIDGDGNVTPLPYSATTTGETSSMDLVISGGSFQGLKFVGGSYFSYFQVPDKPVFEYPSPSGQITTFTPQIFWSNTERADEYMVQVNYNTGDTGFTGTVFTYIVPKTADSKQEAFNVSKESASEFSTTKDIRKYQLSLKSNTCLIYRVGNVNKIENLFGVKQSVVTFSENKSICTQTEPIKSYVYTESDSRWVSEVSRLQTPPSLENESPLGEYILSGMVSGSTVTGATMQLIYPNSSYVTTPTDTTGYFEFTSLEEGTYTLNTSYRGYASDSRSVVISADTSLYIEIEINWDNTYDIWAIKESDIIKY